MFDSHSKLLNKPNNNTCLYKVIKSNYFIDMLEKQYLYFRRVDAYNDDLADSAQPENHKESFKHLKNPKNFYVNDYYRRCRSRSYACCFSTANNDYIWENYAGGDPNSVCLVFSYIKLYEHIKSIYNSTSFYIHGKSYENFFDINFGLVKYRSQSTTTILRVEKLPNPIDYVYYKDIKYEQEKEFRISLTAPGYPLEYVLPDNTTFQFPEAINITMPLRDMLSSQALQHILYSPNATHIFKKEVCEVMRKYRIAATFDKKE